MGDVKRRCGGCAYWDEHETSNCTARPCHHSSQSQPMASDGDIPVHLPDWWCQHFWPESVPLPRLWESGPVHRAQEAAAKILERELANLDEFDAQEAEDVERMASLLAHTIATGGVAATAGTVTIGGNR